MKRIFLFISSLIILIFAATQKPSTYMEVKFKKVSCKFSDLDFVYPNFSCFAKVFSRKVSTATVYYVLKKPSYEFYVQGILSYRYGTITREVIRAPKIEFCQAVRIGNELTIVKEFFKVANSSAPGIVHECPYYGFDLRNVSMKISEVPSIFPTGDYKFDYQISFKEKDTPQINISILAYVNSNIKDSFG